MSLEAVDAVGALLALVEKVVQGIVCVPSSAPLALAMIVAVVDNDINMPTALLAIGGNLVDGVGVWLAPGLDGDGLLVLCEEVVSAVPKGHGGNGWSICIVLRRGAGQQVAAGALFMAGVVCEEVLEEPWRCLACTARVSMSGRARGKDEVPGAMAAAGRARQAERLCMGGDGNRSSARDEAGQVEHASKRRGQTGHQVSIVGGGCPAETHTGTVSYEEVREWYTRAAQAAIACHALAMLRHSQPTWRAR